MLEENEIVVNKGMLKALGAETRVRILTSLQTRQKTQSELAEELKLSSPTILEHLKELETAGLVERRDNGHKWKYYHLTKTGKSLKSGVPVRALILLAVGLFMVCGAFFTSFNHMENEAPYKQAAPALYESALTVPAEDTSGQRSTEDALAITQAAPPPNESAKQVGAEETLLYPPSIGFIMTGVGAFIAGIGIGYWLRK